MTKEEFLREVKLRRRKVDEYLLSYEGWFSSFPEDIRACVTGDKSYIRGGKGLRPAVLLWTCGLISGDEQTAIPAAAAVEVWHDFTLVHDDIMDRDSERRGKPTIHEYAKDVALSHGIEKGEAKHYGICTGIMVGDLLDGWSKILLGDLYPHVDAEIVLTLIRELENEVMIPVMGGQTKDILFEEMEISAINVDDIVRMLGEKTGALYGYCGKAGAMIGLRTSDRNDGIVRSISELCREAGIAFQLRDDVLGLIGDPNVTGKSTDSDIMEGKITTIARYAWENASSEERKRLDRLLGTQNEDEIEEVKSLLMSGIAETMNLAEKYRDSARKRLDEVCRKIDISEIHSELLLSWINFAVERDF